MSNHPRVSIRLVAPLALLVAALSIAASHRAVADDLVTLHLRDGRTFTGRIDSRSDGSRLWLQFGNRSISVKRPISWDAIASAQQQDQELTIDALRRLAAEAKPVEATDVVPGGDDRAGDNTPTPDKQPTAFVPPAFSPPSPRNPVTSIQVDAYAANWDADVEVDGLIVHVRPLDRFGQLVAAAGTLDVELNGLDGSSRNSPSQGLPQLRRLGVWSRSLTGAEIGADGFCVKLPYQAFQPEFRNNAYPFGLVQVRLTVPGDGVFAATYDGVRLRPYSALRDAQQRATGRRFLPGERIGAPNR